MAASYPTRRDLFKGLNRLLPWLRSLLQGAKGSLRAERPRTGGRRAPGGPR